MTVSSDKPKTPSGAWKKFVAILKYIFIDGLSGMALGLFATLIIGTIIGKIGSIIGGTIGGYIVIAGKFAQFMMGAGYRARYGVQTQKGSARRYFGGGRGYARFVCGQNRRKQRG